MYRYSPVRANAHANASPATGADSTFAPPEGADGVFLTVTAQGVYITMDGTTPSASNGIALPAGYAGLLPIVGTLTVRAVTTGAILNVLWVR